jgi:adenylate cyclase
MTEVGNVTLQERRLVTVLFADFVGFTALADTLDPEELQELMAGIFHALAEEALREDGTIEKFIGDAIFVVFGAPTAHEDDATRALRTAMAMQRVFAEHAAVVRSRHGRELGLRIGVHTGIVVAGNVRSESEYGVMGDTVNVAARLQQAAQPGEILVTQATFRLTSQRFSFREVGPIELKGKERPVLAYALVGELDVARPLVELNTPLVGRWMELSRLDLAYQSAVVGRPEFVAIAGEPGIGKTRLITEFLGLLAAPRDEGAGEPRILRWSYPSVGVRSYAGFIETLYEAFEVDPGAPDSRERVRARVRELAADGEGLVGEIWAFLGLSEPPPSETADADETRRRRYAAVREVHAALSRSSPLVLVLEDVHNADTGSVDLLTDLLTHPPRGRLLYVVSYRTLPERLGALSARANFTNLILDPLSAEESGRIVESILEWVPKELRDQIVGRAGGNPFFIEETIRALIESEAIVRDGEEWRLVRAPTQLDVPATLHAVVAARIDRLPPLARECAQVASVIGPRFSLKVLRGASSPEVAAAVEQLVEADLVVVEPGPAHDRLGRHRFKHAITQDVAYQTLLMRRRTELHRRVAQAIEEAYSDDRSEVYPALAHHYALADVPDRAAEYAWKAAKAAMSAHAYGDVQRYAEQAASLFERLEKPDEAVKALILLGQAHRYRGETELTGVAYQRALQIAERGDARGPRVRELYALIAENSARWGARLADPDAFIERGLELVGTEPSRERALLLVARAFNVRRNRRATASDRERALQTAREALSIAEELGALDVVSICLDAVGYAERVLGRFADALERHRRRIPIAQTLQNNDELIDAYTMVADCLSVVGTLREAADYARKSQEISASTGKDQMRRAAMYVEARARLMLSEFHAVLDVGREVMAMRPPRDIHYVHTLAFAVGAAAALADPAERDFRNALVLAEARASALAAADFFAAFYGMRPGSVAYESVRAAGWPSAPSPLVLFLPLRALAAARWGIDDQKTLQLARTAVEQTGHTRGAAMLAHADAVRGGPETDAKFALALGSYERLGLAFEHALCLHDMAHRRMASGSPDGEVSQLLHRARTVAEAPGATALLAALRG